MHPKQKELWLFCRDSCGDELREKIKSHLSECEFCSELAAELTEQMRSFELTRDDSLSDAAEAVIDRIMSPTKSGSIVALVPLGVDLVSGSTMLAADGEQMARSGLENLTTLYSEEPEFVLRVMRDHDTDSDFLQLIGGTPDAVAHLKIEAPELDLGLLTDENGRANIEAKLPESIETVKWQIKMPETVFSFEPIQFEQDETEYADELILETERDDRIRIRFEGKADCKKISIEVIMLDGNSDCGPLTLLVSQGTHSDSARCEKSGAAEFELTDNMRAIDIRVFQ